MNITLFYVCTVNPLTGGVERATWDLKRMLEGLGHTVTIVCWKKTAEMDGVAHLPDQCGLRTEENVAFFREFVRRHGVEVVIDQSAYSVGCDVFCSCVRDMGVRLVGMFHVTLFGSFGQRYPLKGKFFYWTFILLAKLKYRKHCAELARDYDRFVVLSESYKREVGFFCGKAAQARASAIANTLPFQPLRELPEKEKTVLWVGRMSEEKQPSKMLQIWQRVMGKYSDWQLVMLGDGPLMEQTRRLVHDMRLERVTLPGFCKPDDYYAQAAVLCMTSSNEGLPLVLLEAMSYGCVPMAFDSFASVSDVITDGEDGLLIKPYDIEAYAEKLALLMDHADERHRLQSARMKKLEKFSQQTIAKKWQALLNNL